MEQLKLSLFSGPQLRDQGIKKALDNANSHHDKWSEIAYRFLTDYIRTRSEFMVEEIRQASEGTVPEPPSRRAWGGIVVRAAKNGVIKRCGFRNVTNPKAHSTPATLWSVV